MHNVPHATPGQFANTIFRPFHVPPKTTHMFPSVPGSLNLPYQFGQLNSGLNFSHPTEEYQVQQSSFLSSGNVEGNMQQKSLSSSQKVPSLSNDARVSSDEPVNLTSAPTASLPASSNNSNKPSNNSSDTSPAPIATVIITNACLAFLRSEMYRKVDSDIIETVSQFFSYDEIKNARRELFIYTENKRYLYKGLAGTATNKQKAGHCIGSIIGKFRQLENSGLVTQIACLAEDLFRITQINNRYVNIEERLSNLEREVCNIKSDKSATTTTKDRSQRAPPPPYTASSNRETLLNDVLRSQVTPVRSRSDSVKRRRSPSDEKEFSMVSHKRNGVKSKIFTDDSRNNVGNNNDLTGAEYADVFLCNYKMTATSAAVKEHFKDKYKLSVISVRERSHPQSEIKSFVMRLRNKDDYNKVIKVLPFQTGARWYDPFPDPNKRRPRLHFNNIHSSPVHLLNRSQEINRAPDTNGAVDHNWPNLTPNGATTPVISAATPAGSPAHYTPAAARNNLLNSTATPAGSPAHSTPTEASNNLQIRPLLAAGNTDPSASSTVTMALPKFTVGGPISMETSVPPVVLNSSHINES